jgi:glycerol-3-phosphate dehydrogenase (NAD(P)+)
MKKIGMLGGGAWGTALSNLVADNGYEVILWCYEQDVKDCITGKHINERYLPTVKLSPLIKPTNDIQELFSGSDIIFEAIPVPHMRSVLQMAKPYVQAQHHVVVLSKGLEQNTLLLPSQIVTDVVGAHVPVTALAGPSFAQDVAARAATAFDIAGTDSHVVCGLQKLLHNKYCRTYACDDLIGVQCGGAFKNVLALGLGILDGSSCVDNTKAFVFTRGLYEMALCAQALGGKLETLYGLSGVGDLVLTSMGQLSRNAYLGKCLGKGKTIDTVVQELGTVPEGISTVESVSQLAQRHNLDLPVFTGIHAMMQGKMTVQKFLEGLVAHKGALDCM